MICPICKKELEEGLSDCPYCGTPIEIKNGEYQKSTLKSPVKSKLSKEREHEEYVLKNRTVSGVLSIISFPLLLGAIIFMLFAFVTFNDGTSGLKLTPYSILFLAPSFICAIIAFFKSKDINFKSVYRLSVFEVIANGILILVGVVILVLISLNTIQ